MTTEFQNYKGLFGDDVFNYASLDIHFEPLKLRSATYNFEIAEHLHTDLVQLFFIENGEARVRSEGNEIQLKAPSIVFVPQGVLHGFSFSETIEGEVLTLNESLFNACLEGLPNIFIHFQQLRYIPFKENIPAFNELMGTRFRLRNELNEKKVAKEKIIELLLQILIVRLYRLVVGNTDKILANNKRKLKHYNRFIKLIKRETNNSLSVGNYAQQLQISTGHLNRICKELVHKSALKIIHEQLLQKAKRELLTTNKSIADIAYELDFNEPSHFSKFFKRMTTQTPKTYRNSKLS